MRTTLAIAAIATLMALAPAAAMAATECQGSPAGGTGSDAASAWENWHDNVTNAYGAAWAKLELAQSKSVAPFAPPTLGPSTTIYMAFAIPCRTVRVSAGLANNVGNLDLMQSNDAGPSATTMFKKHKLVATFR
jgi:hypothetical protein